MKVNEFIGVDLSRSIDAKTARRVYESASPETPTFMCDIEAIHAGRTKNNTIYSKKELRKALPSWTMPYEKPVLWNHESGGGFLGNASDPLGRVSRARYTNRPEIAEVGKPVKGDPDWGDGAVVLSVQIVDREAIEKIVDRRYMTTSIGSNAESAVCHVCGINLNDEYCNHERGKTYKDDDGNEKMGGWLMLGLEHAEISFVNTPSDIRSRITKVKQENYAAEKTGRFEAFIVNEGKIVESGRVGDLATPVPGTAWAWDGRKPIALSKNATLPDRASIAYNIANLEFASVAKDNSRKLVLAKLPISTEYEAGLAYEIACAMWDIFSKGPETEKNHLDEIAKFYMKIQNSDKMNYEVEETTESVAEYAIVRGIAETKTRRGLMEVKEMTIEQLAENHDGVKALVEKTTKSDELQGELKKLTKVNEELQSKVSALDESAKKATGTIKELNEKVEGLEGEKKSAGENVEKVTSELEASKKSADEQREKHATETAEHDASIKDALIENILDLQEAKGEFEKEERESKKSEYAEKDSESIKGSLDELRKTIKRPKPQTTGALMTGEVEGKKEVATMDRVASLLVRR